MTPEHLRACADLLDAGFPVTARFAAEPMLAEIEWAARRTGRDIAERSGRCEVRMADGVIAYTFPDGSHYFWPAAPAPESALTPD